MKHCECQPTTGPFASATRLAEGHLAVRFGDAIGHVFEADRENHNVVDVLVTSYGEAIITEYVEAEHGGLSKCPHCCKLVLRVRTAKDVRVERVLEPEAVTA